MTEKKESGAPWHHTMVDLQPDIYQQALVLGIDISDACNRALAGLTGREYHGLNDVPAPPPVIIAGNGTSLPAAGEINKGRPQKLHPVINADDPAAPARVVQAKVPAVKKAPAEPPAPAAPVPVTPEEKPSTAPAAMKKAAVRKSRSESSKKKPRGDALRTFFSSKIIRTDDEGSGVGKDELYELFARFCHEHRITPVPERRTVTIALKNQYALTEKPVNGTPSWIGIRLK